MLYSTVLCTHCSRIRAQPSTPNSPLSATRRSRSNHHLTTRHFLPEIDRPRLPTFAMSMHIEPRKNSSKLLFIPSATLSGSNQTSLADISTSEPNPLYWNDERPCLSVTIQSQSKISTLSQRATLSLSLYMLGGQPLPFQ